MRLNTKVITILDAVTSIGAGTTMDVGDVKNIVILFSSDSSSNSTTQFQGSAAETAPDFTAVQSTANHWDYVAVNDYQDAAKINGDTGIVLTGTDDVRTLLLNVDAISWLNADMTARSAGSVTVKAIGYDNN